MNKITRAAAAITLGAALIAGPLVTTADAGRVKGPEQGRVQTVASSTDPAAASWSDCGFWNWVTGACGRKIT